MIPRRGLSLSLALFALSCVASSGVARAQWAGTPWPGVRYLERTDPGPVRVRALEVDLCDPGMTIRATRPAEANRTVSAWGSAVGVQAAVNANMWHCGALCGVGIGNSERFAADDDAHWGYLSFSPDGVDYPWDYEVHLPPIWVEQAVGGHPRLVNDGAPMPEFAGGCLERHPRTAAGFSHGRERLILAIADGRSTSSVGMTCASMARLMTELGAHEAINLDGGGSTTMWLSDRGVVNRPSDGAQRTVRNHLGVFTHGEGTPRHCGAHRALPVEAGVLRPVSAEVSGAFRFSLLDLRLWPQGFIDAYARGPALEAPRLVRADGDPAIYLIDRGRRRHVTSPRSLVGWHLHHVAVEVLPAAEVAAIPLGPPLTQFAYLAVSPAHEVFLVDHPEPIEPPEPPEPPDPPVQRDAGTPTAPDAGLPAELDAGAPALVDASASPIDAGGSTLRGTCAATPPRGASWAALVALALVARARRR
ncbi:MAG: phosphodiester glycosidase family protein [Sandaracinaceae bacterium]|nr:phosphodiester glycosidase family protein [Sandaracinaceae bacterium]